MIQTKGLKIVPAKNEPKTPSTPFTPWKNDPKTPTWKPRPEKKKEPIKYDPQAVKAQNKILWNIIWEQKGLILIGFPFLFLSAVGDFMFPDQIGKIVEEMRKKEDEAMYD